VIYPYKYNDLLASYKFKDISAKRWTYDENVSSSQNNLITRSYLNIRFSMICLENWMEASISVLQRPISVDHEGNKTRKLLNKQAVDSISAQQANCNTKCENSVRTSIMAINLKFSCFCLVSYAASMKNNTFKLNNDNWVKENHVIFRDQWCVIQKYRSIIPVRH